MNGWKHGWEQLEKDSPYVQDSQGYLWDREVQGDLEFDRCPQD